MYFSQNGRGGVDDAERYNDRGVHTCVHIVTIRENNKHVLGKSKQTNNVFFVQSRVENICLVTNYNYCQKFHKLLLYSLLCCILRWGGGGGSFTYVQAQFCICSEFNKKLSSTYSLKGNCSCPVLRWIYYSICREDRTVFELLVSQLHALCWGLNEGLMLLWTIMKSLDYII